MVDFGITIFEMPLAHDAEIMKPYCLVANAIVNMSELPYFTTTIAQMATVKYLVLLFGLCFGISKSVLATVCDNLSCPNIILSFFDHWWRLGLPHQTCTNKHCFLYFIFVSIWFFPGYWVMCPRLQKWAYLNHHRLLVCHLPLQYVWRLKHPLVYCQLLHVNPSLLLPHIL